MYLETKIAENQVNMFNIFNTFEPHDYVYAAIEILILAFCIFKILEWIKNTRAWTLLKGILVILIFGMIVYYMEFEVILYIYNKMAFIAAIAVIVIFQNDIRAGLEHLGRQNYFSKIFPNHKKIKANTSEYVAREIAAACFYMAKYRTGALIVIEKKEILKEIENTGIIIDGKVSKALLINIFEKNTPLHDGAVLIVDDVVKAATCYLPLSSNKNISKSLGTRHRAGLGISEISDSQTIVVSEETGRVIICQGGKMEMVNDEKELINKLLL